MRARPLQHPSWRGAFLALAALALALQVLVPQGLMLSGAPGRTTVVICTGHGPLAALSDAGKSKAPAPKGKADAACLFAVHGAGPASTPPTFVAAIAWPAYVAVTLPQPQQVFIGRGLAAPPPARAPPARLV